VIFAVLFGLTARRGATDPVCGMKVDRAKAMTTEIAGETYYFCSRHCIDAFEARPVPAHGPVEGRQVANAGGLHAPVIHVRTSLRAARRGAILGRVLGAR
jgi:YHS domain-containing protein